MTRPGTARGREDLVAKVVAITSGKGGVGKTTTAAAFAAGLALRGHKTVVIDFDVGLRNLDLVMGCERRLVFDFINVINGDANLNQALIKDKRNDNLYIFPTSQTRDKDALKREGVERVLEELKQQFDFIICDSPAGIEHGAVTALYFADAAIIVTNPEVSSVRDSDRIIGILASRSRRAERNEPPVETNLLLTVCSASSVRCALCSLSAAASSVFYLAGRDADSRHASPQPGLSAAPEERRDRQGAAQDRAGA